MVAKEDKSATVIGPEDDEDKKQRQQMDQFWRAAESIGARNADKDPDEVLEFVTAVVEEVRRENYERKQREARERR